MMELNKQTENFQVNTIRNFYKFHARFYQATRWSFLFGRRRLIQAINLPSIGQSTLLEVGCGTGHNLKFLASHFPNLKLFGVDISPDMLRVASRNLNHLFAPDTFSGKTICPGQLDFAGKTGCYPVLLLPDYDQSRMGSCASTGI